MNNRLSRLLPRLDRIKWLPYFLAGAGAALYILLAVIKAQSLSTYVDEGMYLYKGYLFLTGQYTPYQDFGVWTNKPPLAFLVPGTIQYLFGPGLGVGRTFYIFLALLTILGLWILAVRFAGPWAGIIVPWAFALNPAEIKNLTLVITEGQVAFTITWALVCILALKRKPGHFLLAGLLGGLTIMTRIETLPFFGLLILYVWWQHGIRSAGWTVAGLLPPILIFHIIYWPGILALWTWLPGAVTPFLDVFRVTAGSLATASTPASLYLTYFWLVIRLHPFSFLGAISVLLLWPARSKWKSTFHFKMAAFLAIAFFGLWAEYLMIAFGMDFCVSCIITYAVFFDYIGLLLLIVSFSSLKRSVTPLRSAAVFIIMAISVVLILYSGAEDLKDFSRFLVSFPVPRIRGMQFQPGTAQFWVAVRNKFGLGLDFFYVVVPIALGILAAVVLILFVRRLHRARWTPLLSPAYLMVCTLLILSFVLSPTRILAGGNDYFACKNVLKSFDRVGDQLSGVVQPGEKVYWEGRSAAIFLYLPQVSIYPPQLNHDHSFRIGSDPNELLKRGFWNQELATQWLNEADIILIEKPYLRDWEEQILYYSNGGYTEVMQTSFLGACDGATRIVVLRKK